MFFDTDLTKAERDAMIANRQTIVARADGSGTPTGAQFNALFNLLEQVTRLNIDDAQLKAEDREFSRSLDVNGIPYAPAYRHEFLMGSDLGYMQAWRYIHDENFAAIAEESELEMERVLDGQARHTYFESDPVLVDQSLAINGLRPLRDGEVMPRSPVGREAPNATTPDFSYAAAGLTVTFTDESEVLGAPTSSRLWTFGDGGTSTQANPTRVYASAGTYNVTLAVTNSGGTTEVTKSITVSAQDVNGKAIAWGYNGNAQTVIPSGAASGIIEISAGSYHSLALKQSGGVVGWGYNGRGEITIPLNAQSGVEQVAAGGGHSMALKLTGNIITWGDNTEGQRTLPQEVIDGNVVYIAAGDFFSACIMDDGSVFAWGRNDYGQATIPGELIFSPTMVKCGGYHGLALNGDGEVIGWGLNNLGQVTIPPEAQDGVVAIAAGGSFSLALKNDGSVIGWGANTYGTTVIPAGAQSGVSKIDAGYYHGLALKTNGQVVAWGLNDDGQVTVPLAGQSSCFDVSAGAYHSVAARPV